MIFAVIVVVKLCSISSFFLRVSSVFVTKNSKSTVTSHSHNATAPFVGIYSFI